MTGSSWKERKAILIRHRIPRAFTLIELLVVVAIIAILAAILFPVFAQAREKAKQTACISNLKQTALAFDMYTQDNDQTYPMAVYNSTDYTVETAWDYTITRDRAFKVLKLQQGLIGAYTKSNAVSSCPSNEIKQQWGRPYTGYAYNTSYIGCIVDPPEFRQPATESSIAQPSDTILIADSAMLSGATRAGNNYLRAPLDIFYGYTGPNIHFRHLGVATVAYCDGHVKSAKTKYHALTGTPDLADLSEDDSAYDLQ